MNITADILPYPSLTIAPSGGAESEDSERILSELIFINNDCFEKPNYIRQAEIEGALVLLEEVFEECSEADWDGYDALPISQNTYLEAKKLIEILPPNIPIPDIVPEPTGEIGFEWYNKKSYTFVISVGGNEIISYAGLFGEVVRAHGIEEFIDTLPSTIIRNIYRVYQGD